MEQAAHLVPLNWYLFLSTFLFCIGVMGVLFRRNAIIILMCICLLYTSDAADERSSVDLGGRRIIKKKNRPHISSRARP
mgnify:CR=1 FL=1